MAPVRDQNGKPLVKKKKVHHLNCHYFPSIAKNHSNIVDTFCAKNHSNIVEAHEPYKKKSLRVDLQKIQTVGIFNKLPIEVFNPAFTGMYLWELSSTHELNDYHVCKYHAIRSGVILYGSEAYVFTQITNNDITSHLKIFLRRRNFRNEMKLNQAMKLVLNYVRSNSKRTIIPSIHGIQKDLYSLIGITEDDFVGEVNTYMTLLYRVYLLLFMLHYKMPLQRKNAPGNRNSATSIYSYKSRGWYAYLSTQEQNILQNPGVFISENSMPDDLIEGITRNNMTDFSKIMYEDVQNCSMFREYTSIDSMLFQQNIHAWKYQHSKYHTEKIPTCLSTSKKQKINHNSSIGTNTKLEEVPNIQNLKQQVDKLIHIQLHQFNNLEFIPWNKRFHHIVEKCDLQSSFSLNSLPTCYKVDSSCGHVFQVQLKDAFTNSLYLTMLESLDTETLSYTSIEASKFIQTVLFTNPIWDLGLQFTLATKKVGILYSSKLNNSNKLTSNCVCPCSSLLKEWHIEHCLTELEGFVTCNSTIFESHTDFVKHLHSQSHDYYHRIIMRLVQSTYSVLISKLKIKPLPKENLPTKNSSRFGMLHKGKVSLPSYVKTSAEYVTFFTKKNDVTIALSRTNILNQTTKKEFISWFSETSFSTTLEELIACGQYNKTKKRSTPMYCFGSTITCTRYPKFFCDGKTQILPRPYQRSKPNNTGYSIIRSSWMQSFIKDVEIHVLHYLHNICPDKEMKKLTLLNIQLSKKIIPECLRLGDSFFTHMSVFGTINKEDGEMPIHFDERDLISCVFHLGRVQKGGSTSYYDGCKADDPGQRIHQVPFHHGTLQIGFFNSVLHGVDDWVGQRCGIQLNIKKDVLKHFVKYGTFHYDKYRMTGYPQGPIVYC